jgi:hypothetical protein
MIPVTALEEPIADGAPEVSITDTGFTIVAAAALNKCSVRW